MATAELDAAQVALDGDGLEHERLVEAAGHVALEERGVVRPGALGAPPARGLGRDGVWHAVDEVVLLALARVAREAPHELGDVDVVAQHDLDDATLLVLDVLVDAAVRVVVLLRQPPARHVRAELPDRLRLVAAERLEAVVERHPHHKLLRLLEQQRRDRVLVPLQQKPDHRAALVHRDVPCRCLCLFVFVRREKTNVPSPL